MKFKTIKLALIIAGFTVAGCGLDKSDDEKSSSSITVYFNIFGSWNLLTYSPDGQKTYELCTDTKKTDCVQGGYIYFANDGLARSGTFGQSIGKIIDDKGDEVSNSYISKSKYNHKPGASMDMPNTLELASEEGSSLKFTAEISFVKVETGKPKRKITWKRNGTAFATATYERDSADFSKSVEDFMAERKGK